MSEMADDAWPEDVDPDECIASILRKLPVVVRELRPFIVPADDRIIDLIEWLTSAGEAIEYFWSDQDSCDPKRDGWVGGDGRP